MRIYSFGGTPRDIGRAFGESCRADIHRLYSLRIDNAIAQALRYGGQVVDEARVLFVARRSLAATAAYDPAGFAELEGIAEGAGLPIEKVLALNGLTDFRDVLSWPHALDDGGCTAVVVARDRSASGEVLCGQTWDLATDNLPHTIGVRRAPVDAPETWCLTTDGCLSLIGMNAEGLAVGTTNIRTTDARPGVNYLSIIHRALACRDLDAAVAAIVEAPRAGAHFYYLADRRGRAALVECSALHAFREDLTAGVAVHANHCLLPETMALEGSVPSPSSRARQRRMSELAEGGPLRLADLEAAFADTANGPDAICRDDIDGLNTNGAVVMAPESGTMRVCHGAPSRGAWIELRAPA
ncbi:MAG: hypothetical protein IT385_10930 [Deltaproteobacteria bacterium]|nr:hypothetical protein [Deltaproteobacteria bacterium]